MIQGPKVIDLAKVRSDAADKKVTGGIKKIRQDIDAAVTIDDLKKALKKMLKIFGDE